MGANGRSTFLPPLAVVFDIPASPSLLVAGGVVLCVLVAIPAFKGLLDIIQWFRGSPPNSEKFATKHEVDDLERRIAESATERNRQLLSSVARAEQRMIEIKGEIMHQLDQGQTIFSSLQREQNTITAIVAELKGEVKSMLRSKN